MEVQVQAGGITTGADAADVFAGGEILADTLGREAAGVEVKVVRGDRHAVAIVAVVEANVVAVGGALLIAEAIDLGEDVSARRGVDGLVAWSSGEIGAGVPVVGLRGAVPCERRARSGVAIEVIMRGRVRCERQAEADVFVEQIRSDARAAGDDEQQALLERFNAVSAHSGSPCCRMYESIQK